MNILQNISFFGNKLAFTNSKNVFDNIQQHNLQNYDTVMYLDDDLISFGFKNQDNTIAKLCINAIFGYVMRYPSTKNLIFHDLKVHLKDDIITITKEKPIKSIASTLNATLYDVANQHWIVEKDSSHFIPTDKSVNIHKYYGVKNFGETIECTASFFERGVGKTKACGSGAFCVGTHLLSLHPNAKTVIVITEDGNEYYVADRKIGVCL